jgi:hypothetical protein
MNYYFAATTLLIGLTVAARVDAASPVDVSNLITRTEMLNDKCRGGSGDDPRTQQACTDRDKLASELKQGGWCYGRPGQAEYQRKWQPCADPIDRLMASIPMPHKPDWQKVEAANGAVFMVDMNSVFGGNGRAEVLVYAVEGDTYVPDNMKKYFFDCHGSYATSDELFNHYAPPRSVVGVISAMACGKAK